MCNDRIKYSVSASLSTEMPVLLCYYELKVVLEHSKNNSETFIIIININNNTTHNKNNIIVRDADFFTEHVECKYLLFFSIKSKYLIKP